VIQLLLIDNVVVLLLAFWLGISFALQYPEVAQEFLNTFSWVERIVGN
jgi:hypothetical protein